MALLILFIPEPPCYTRHLGTSQIFFSRDITTPFPETQTRIECWILGPSWGSDRVSLPCV